MLEVIIVDDDQIVVFIQKKMISNHEIASYPISFNEAKAALDYLNEEQLNTDKKEFLIFLDINMPNMNGWDFLDCLKTHDKKVNYHVVMVTSSINKRDKERSKNYNMVRLFIEKPIRNLDCEKIKEIPEISRFFVQV